MPDDPRPLRAGRYYTEAELAAAALAAVHRVVGHGKSYPNRTALIAALNERINADTPRHRRPSPKPACNAPVRSPRPRPESTPPRPDAKRTTVAGIGSPAASPDAPAGLRRVALAVLDWRSRPVRRATRPEALNPAAMPSTSPVPVVPPECAVPGCDGPKVSLDDLAGVTAAGTYFVGMGGTPDPDAAPPGSGDTLVASLTREPFDGCLALVSFDADPDALHLYRLGIRPAPAGSRVTVWMPDGRGGRIVEPPARAFTVRGVVTHAVRSFMPPV